MGVGCLRMDKGQRQCGNAGGGREGAIHELVDGGQRVEK